MKKKSIIITVCCALAVMLVVTIAVISVKKHNKIDIAKETTISNEKSTSEQTTLNENNTAETKDDVESSENVNTTSASIEEKTTKPVEKTTKPVEKTTKPAEKTTKPVEKTTKPVEKTTKPVEKTTKADNTALYNKEIADENKRYESEKANWNAYYDSEINTQQIKIDVANNNMATLSSSYYASQASSLSNEITNKSTQAAYLRRSGDELGARRLEKEVATLRTQYTDAYEKQILARDAENARYQISALKDAKKYKLEQLEKEHKDNIAKINTKYKK